jgi:hypothetical protein
MGDVAFGVLGVVLICPAFAGLARSSVDASTALMQLALVVVALLAASVWSADVVGVLGAVGVLVPVALVWLLRPDRWSMVRQGSWGVGRSPSLLACALVLVVPAWVHAGVNATHGRDELPPQDSFAFAPSHWAAVTAMLLATGLVALLAATHRGGGWTVSALSVAAAVLLFGVGSVVNPDVPSSGGRGWGVAAIVWVVAWLVATGRARRAQNHPWCS